MTKVSTEPWVFDWWLVVRFLASRVVISFQWSLGIGYWSLGIEKLVVIGCWLLDSVLFTLISVPPPIVYQPPRSTPTYQLTTIPPQNYSSDTSIDLW